MAEAKPKKARLTVRLLSDAFKAQERIIARMEARITVLESAQAEPKQNAFVPEVPDLPWNSELHTSNEEEQVEGILEAIENAPVLNDTDGTQSGTYPCQRCHGTGRYITRVENGKPTGPAGHDCFRCSGKGHHTQADRKRNYGHIMNYVPPGMRT